MNSEYKEDVQKTRENYLPELQKRLKNIDPSSAPVGCAKKVMKLVIGGKVYWVDMAQSV